MADRTVDFLVIGSGVSGLYAAYHLADHGKVLLITKSNVVEANTSYAQGGIASVLATTDSFESHIQDTLDAGAGLCDPEAVRILVTEGPRHIHKLMEMGAEFDRNAKGDLHLGREGGHSANRIVHSGDLTGKEVEDVLVDAVHRKGVELLEYTCGVELITNYHVQDEAAPGEKPPACYGAYVYDRNTWEISIIRARATILASGGAGRVYLHNTNPDVATGDGVALAYRAGAVVANMEFYQFHPTSLYMPGENSFLITEALRGFGAKLLDFERRPFMDRYDERQELAPRDIVARAIDAEMKRSGAPHVWLDCTGTDQEELMARFPNIYATCLKRGIDIGRQPIPVVPAAHYMCGGVRTDLHGRTRLAGLYAVGEVACTGVHGGNRLASNSLLEGLVFAHRIAEVIPDDALPQSGQLPLVRPWQKEGLLNPEEWILVQHNFGEIRHIMWNYVGIVRSTLRLNRALRRINLLYDEIMDFYKRTVLQTKSLELRNLVLIARLIIESALERQESRGLHFNTDYPENRDPSNHYTERWRTS